MRAPLLLAAMLALAACGKNAQSDGTQNADENLTAESIVSNDVTAIDAVTGDAANMAADVDMNYVNVDLNETDTAPGESKPKSSRPMPQKPRAAEASNTAANAAGNAE
jgi:hypothetical protein